MVRQITLRFDNSLFSMLLKDKEEKGMSWEAYTRTLDYVDTINKWEALNDN